MEFLSLDSILIKMSLTSTIFCKKYKKTSVCHQSQNFKDSLSTKNLIVTGTSSPIWSTRRILRRILHRGPYTTITYIVYIFSKNGICEIKIWNTKWFIRSSTFSGTDTGTGTLVPYRTVDYISTIFSRTRIIFSWLWYDTVRTYYRYYWFEKNWHPRIRKGWIILWENNCMQISMIF